ncbi:uncharacterized protein C2845_PM01G30970 [Panicum miliaceum]|uniref:EamA domain-containing protein n=1 Tax=Panicum miliaceum TaxID=4540 RepID=A0A3L6TH40_PANMI|nr:uncharacterized protein C2845_PM01G30970 [Panicum miliaceum]
MASSIASASWALPLRTGGSGAGSAVAVAGPSCRVLLAVAAPRSAAPLLRARVLGAPRCAAPVGPGASGEEEAKIEEEGKKRARGRPVWRRILFASKKTRSIIMLNALTVIYASDIPVLKEVEALTEPAVFNMVRFVVAAIPFVPFAVRAFGDRRVRNAGLELGVWVSLAYLAQAIGLLSSDAGRASFITAFTVIVVPLIDGLLGASIPKITWFGAIVSLVGIGLLECGGSPPCVGDVLNFFSALFFGIHMLRTEQISRSTDKKKFLALLSFEVLVVAFSSVLWFMFKDGYVDTSESSFESWTFGMLWDAAASFPWIPALYTGVLSTVLCMWAEMVAMGDVSATETAIVYGLEPVWGAAFAWLLLGERWDNAAWIGAALVLCGSLTVQLFGAAPEKSKKVEKHNRNALETPVKRQDYLSLSPIPVDSRKIIGRQLERGGAPAGIAVPPRQAPQAVATGAVTPNHHRLSSPPPPHVPSSHPTTLARAQGHASTPPPAPSTTAPRTRRRGNTEPRVGLGGQNAVASRRVGPEWGSSPAQRNGTGWGGGGAHHARDRDTARRKRDGNVRAPGPVGARALHRRMGARGPDGSGGPRA